MAKKQSVSRRYSIWKNKCSNAPLGLHNHCRLCQKESRRAWYVRNRESESKKSAAYSKTPKAKAQRKKRYEANRETYLERNRIRRRTPSAKAKANVARQKRRAEDLSFRLSCNLRSRVRKALKGINKSKHTLELLGCSLEKFKVHLESKFSPGMSWSNYGYYGWHVDHVIPCTQFDLSKTEEQAKCFHYTNMQPLWMKDNISKHNR